MAAKIASPVRGSANPGRDPASPVGPAAASGGAACASGSTKAGRGRDIGLDGDQGGDREVGEPGPAVQTAAELGELGLDLVIIILPPPHDPAVLAPLAGALAALR